MNFEMQDLVGSWAFVDYGQRNCIGIITSIDMRGYGGVEGSKIWKPRYPIKMNLLVEVLGGTRWHHPMVHIYLDEVELTTPEVAEIFMQANNLIPPERKRK